MRIQKRIAESGIASRREAEEMILEGRVKVNGELILRPGHPIEVDVDKITIDGKPLPKKERLFYFALHKPRGCICSRKDPQERKSIYDYFSEIPIRIESIGRLDFNTSGIILLTNDGELSHKLTHPSQNVPKRYRVKVWKRPDDKKLQRLRKGINLEDGRTKPAKVKITDSTDTNNTWLEVTVTEGRNKLIRKMFDAIGHPVSKLQRVSFATIAIGQLESGEFRPLNGNEIQRLRDISNGVKPQNAGKKQKYKKGFAKPKIKKRRSAPNRKKGRS